MSKTNAVPVEEQKNKPAASPSYSNSLNDNTHTKESTLEDENQTRTMYEYSPYPDLGADLKSQDLYLNHVPDDFKKKSLTYFDAGCGTGHYIVGVAKKFPHWRCIGMDLSQASIDVAKKLAEKHGVENVEFHRGSYLETLPIEGKADIISAMGTIHHCADPYKAMEHMHAHLSDDGYMLLHMYGWRADQGKFDMKMMLDILEPQLDSYEQRFAYYRALQDFKKGKLLKRLANTSPYQAYMYLRILWRNIRRKMKGITWSPGWHEDYAELDSPWIDHFCHPCERAYEVPAIQDLVKNTGFDVSAMIAQGTEFPQLIPPQWQSRYKELDFWQKARLSELLADGGGSFAMVLKKA